MIIRFTDIDGNVFLVPPDKLTCCVLYTCDDPYCEHYYHYNVVIGKVEVEVKREEFIRVFHWLAHENTGNQDEEFFEIPQQKDKKGTSNESTS